MAPHVGVGVGSTSLIMRGAGGVAPAYNPATEPGAVLFYEADAPSNQLNGGAFSQLTDLTGNGRHATQATGTKQPARIVSGLNGLPVASFDGTSDGMSITQVPLASATTHTLYCVFANGSTTGGDRFILDQNTPRQVWGRSDLGDLDYYFGSWDRTGLASTAAAQVLCFEVSASPANVRILRDGVVIYDSPIATSLAIFPSGALAAIGAKFDAIGNYFAMQLASMLILPSTRANHNAAAIDSYFRTKWGTP